MRHPSIHTCSGCCGSSRGVPVTPLHPFSVRVWSILFCVGRMIAVSLTLTVSICHAMLCCVMCHMYVMSHVHGHADVCPSVYPHVTRRYMTAPRRTFGQLV